MQKEKIREYIDRNRDRMIGALKELIRLPSPDGGPTKAQELVKRKLEEMGFRTESFRMDERVRDCADHCEPGIEYSSDAYNVAGKKKGTGSSRTLMLYGHIDTEAEDRFNVSSDPYEVRIEDGRIIGLGASDDKGGIAMILEALRTAFDLKGDLSQDLIVLSVLGKHGGAFGTLSAMLKGYCGDDAIYVHPAETGHGFQEIKNISLGVLDMKLTVYGKPGIPHDDLSLGDNANLRMGKAIQILEEYDQKKRKEDLFDFGSFQGQPSFLLNIGSLSSGKGPGEICEKAECLFRCRFFLPYRTDEIFEEVRVLLEEKLDGEWVLEKGSFRAEPAMTDSDDPFVSFLETNISEMTGEKRFIHQYHGGSDVRFPILYGNSRCVGIGPYCELPEKGSGKTEWIDEEDYLNGIAVLAKILIEYEPFCVGERSRTGEQMQTEKDGNGNG